MSRVDVQERALVPNAIKDAICKGERKGSTGCRADLKKREAPPDRVAKALMLAFSPCLQSDGHFMTVP